MKTLVAMKINIDGKMQASLLLNSLLDNWKTLLVTITNFIPNEIVTIDMVKHNLFNDEAKRKEQNI